MPPEKGRGSSVPRPKHRARGRLVMRSKRSTSRHARQGCKKGSHTFGPEQQIGGGIVRLICDECGAVSIDLREATDPVTEVPRLERRDWVVEPEPPLWGTRRGR